MKQYCRYCAYLCVGDANYCELKKECFTDSKCKKLNYCKHFHFNKIDAFDLTKVYHERKAAKRLKSDINLFDIEEK